MEEIKEQNAGNTNVEGAGLYAAKIEKLLNAIDQRQSTTYYADERQLVVLVILVNTTLVNSANFQKIWLSNFQQLQVFCRRLLQSKKEVSDTSGSPPLQSKYAQLVAFLLKRVMAIEGIHPEETSMHSVLASSASFLMNLLLEFLKNQEKQRSDLQLTTQIVECLSAYLFVNMPENKPEQSQQNALIVEKYLGSIWDHFVENMKPMITPMRYETDTSASDEDLMENTLDAILLKTDNVMDQEPTTSYNNETGNEMISQPRRERLQTAVESLFRDNLVRAFALPDSPQLLPSLWSWWQHLLSDIAASEGKENVKETALRNLPTQSQRSWHGILLLYARSIASHPYLLDFLQQNKWIGSTVLGMILIHLKSTASDDNVDNLRLAWTTCAAWIDRLQGVEWMFVSESALSPVPSAARSSRKSLELMSPFCALMRLASGEWRIQLGYRLTLREDGSGEDVQSVHAKERDTATLHACAQILAILVTYLGEVAEAMEDSGRRAKQHLSAEALLHLRESLESTLQVTANYLCQLAKLTSTPRLDDEDSVTIQLLGTLLTEFDVFDAHENLDTDEILIAISFAMQHCKDFKAQEQLLACLLGIMEVAKDDSYRVLLLKEHGLIGNNMLSFLQLYWANIMDVTATSLRSVPWACHVTEAWLSILTENMSDIRIQVVPSQITQEIIEWIRSVLEFTEKSRAFSKDEVQHALNAAVGCYVTLHGDTPPSDKEAQILQRALDFCASQR